MSQSPKYRFTHQPTATYLCFEGSKLLITCREPAAARHMAVSLNNLIEKLRSEWPAMDGRDLPSARPSPAYTDLRTDGVNVILSGVSPQTAVVLINALPTITFMRDGDPQRPVLGAFTQKHGAPVVSPQANTEIATALKSLGLMDALAAYMHDKGMLRYAERNGSAAHGVA